MAKETSPLLENNTGNINSYTDDICSSNNLEDSGHVSQLEKELTVSIKSNISRTALSGGLDTGESGTSNLATVVHLFKGNVGTGILSLPAAIKHAGIIVGPISLILVASMAVHCMHLLVKCSHFFCKKFHREALSYGDVAEECSRPFLGSKSKYAKRTVNVMLCITQFGFCSIYLVFTTDTIMEVGDLKHIIDERVIIACLVLPVILLSFVRSLEKLAYISIVANVLCVSGLIMIFQYLSRNLKDPKSYPYFAGWTDLPFFLSMAIFSFEGIGVVLPLENEMKKPKDFPWVLNIGMGIVTALFVSMGLLGYLTYGNNIDGSVTLNLPQNWLYDTVKIAYAVAMFGTYFLQFYVPMQIMLPSLLSKRQDQSKTVCEYLYRTLFVVLTAVFAISIPQLENFIALIGSVASSGLAIIFPPLFHLLTFREHGISRAAVAKDVFIIFVGFLAFVFGGFSSVQAIIKGFEKN